MKSLRSSPRCQINPRRRLSNSSKRDKEWHRDPYSALERLIFLTGEPATEEMEWHEEQEP